MGLSWIFQIQICSQIENGMKKSGGGCVKKFLVIIIVFVSILFAGCGWENGLSRKNETLAVLLKDSFWVAESENIPYMIDAISRKDTEYMKQLMLEGKVFIFDKDTKVVQRCSVSGKNNMEVLFK